MSVVPSVRPSVAAISARVQSSLHSLHLLRKLNCSAFINHPAVCPMTGPQPVPKPVLHTVRSSASSYNFQYPLLCLTSYCSCLRLLHRIHITSILLYFLQYRFQRQSLRKMWSIRLTFHPGADPGFVGPEVYKNLGPSLRKRIQTTNTKLGTKVNIYLGPLPGP